MLLFCNNSERDHVLDELIETAGSEVAKASRAFGCQPVASVIVSVHNEVSAHEYLR